MYVVLEYNQASGMPRVYDTDIHDTEQEANGVADYAREQLKSSGRREPYAIAELMLLDEENADA